MQLSQMYITAHVCIFMAASPKYPRVAKSSNPFYAHKLLFKPILPLKLLNQLDVLFLCRLGRGAFINGFLPRVVLVFTLRRDYGLATQIS